MAFTGALYGPTDRLPNYACGEWQWLHASPSAGETEVLVNAGGGVLATVEIGIAGGAGCLFAFHDANATDTLDSTTELLIINGAITETHHGLNLTFSRGLRVRALVASGAYLTISFSGRNIKNTTQIGAKPL
jgi:hypothetical protein